MERIFETLDVAPDIKNQPKEIPMPTIKEKVPFKGVTFRYKEGKNKISNVSFLFSAGQSLNILENWGWRR
ncbi:hypothetical protein ACEF17_12505, partial [Streptococcus hyovaginalis]